LKILFICTHNRCRSILAEAVSNFYGQGLIEACSAGSNPADQVHPLTLRALRKKGIPISGLKSKSWDEFEDSDFDYVITVCDKAANEPCPLWFGKSRQVHWGLADPSAITGDPEIIDKAFKKTIKLLKQRIKQIKIWLAQGLEENELYQRIQALGLTE
tara:strand:- start:44153 stop:44626 length:474 start_codon:yes stop_codon:yes gene_type:complete